MAIVLVALLALEGLAPASVVEAEPVQSNPGAFDGLGTAKGRSGADPSDLPGEPSPKVGADVSDTGVFYPPAGEAPPADWAPEVAGFVKGESVIVAEKTTATRLVWRNPDGSYTEEQAVSPVRFRDAAGVWRDFDEDLTTRNGRLVPDATPAGESIAPVADSAAVVQAQTDAGPVKLAQSDADAVAGVVDGDEVTFPEAVAGGADLVVSLVPDGFETTIVVPDGAPENAAYEQVLTLPAGAVARNGGPGVQIVDAAGKVVGAYGSGSAYDGAKRPAEAVVRTRLVNQTGPAATVEVSVDPAWLADDERVFPVSIDPTFTQTTGESGNLDTYVQSNITSTPQSAAAELKIGKVYDDTMVRRALLRFDTSAIVAPGNVVTDATLKLWNHGSPSCQLKTMQVRSLGSAFNANTVWSNQPGYGGTNITVPAFAKGYSGCAEGWQDIDIRPLAQKWAEGNANHGIGLQATSEADNLGGKAFRSAESWVPPTLVMTYNRQPVNGTLAAPADAAVVYTTQPKLTVNAGSDPDGDALRYWFSVSTNPDGTGQIISSGWLDTGVREWTVPAGSLLDGSTYYWTVSTWDGVTWPKDPPTPRSMTVDFRLGDSGDWPFDEHGPAKVNLATGNLVVGTGSPTFTTVGGGLGVSYTYNSQASPITGWTGKYYSTFESATKRPAAGQEPALVRRDTTASFDWRAGAIAPSLPVNNTYATWSGYIRVPTAGGYKLGALCDTPETQTDKTRDDATGGVKVTFAGVVQDSWSACNPKPDDPWTPTVTLTAGQVVPVTIEYWTGTGEAALNLKVRGPGIPGGVNGGENLRTTWMSTTAPALPTGWNLSADLDGEGAYRQAVITQDSVTFIDTEETSHRYRWDAAKKSYAAPVGEYGTVARTAAGGVTLIDSDGTTHVFGTDGRLLSVTSALDDTNRAAAQMTWAGEPLRLTEITDPVSSRNITLRYAGDAGCPTSVPTGLAAAPGGMVCALDYSDFSAGTTEFWYTPAGQLARIVDPGNEVTDLAYNSDGRLERLRDPLAADAVAATVRADNDSTYSRFFYWTDKVASIELPEPMAGEDRPTHNYAYPSPNSTLVYAAGLATTTGKLREVTLDAKGRATTDTDQSGSSTVTVYDTQDRVASTRDTATGLKSTNVYDTFGNLTDEWGPAPAAWWPTPDSSGAPTAANQANTPHEVTRFDEGINTLAATWWDNPDLAGTPTARTTGVAATGLPNSSAKEIYQTWGTGGPPELGGGARDFSGRLTGLVNISNTSPWNVRVGGLAGRIRVLIDNQLVVDGWDAGAATTVDGTFTASASGWKSIVIEYSNPSGSAGFDLGWRQGAAAYTRIPSSALNPGYGLETSSTDIDGVVSTTSYTQASSDPTLALGPADRAATVRVTDPAGLALSETTTYETNQYRREESASLPLGTASESRTTYYGSTEARDLGAACPGQPSSVIQGGLAKTVASASPDGSGAGRLVNETIYDAQMRPGATRVVADGGHWTCLSYDARGRATTMAIPELDGRPGRTTTKTYSLFGNPLVRIISDDGPGDDDSATAELLDLLGRTRTYQDAWGNVTTTSYDATGRIYEVSSPAGNQVFTYNPDGTTGPTVVDGQTLATPHYDAAGRLDWVEYANGTKSDPVVRDALGNENSAVWKRTTDGSTIASDVVARRLGGDIVEQAVDGSDPNPAGPNYVYDQAGRLTEAWTTVRSSTGALSAQHVRYRFGTQDPSCPSGTQPNTGKNTNRTSAIIGDGASAVTRLYCYDAADHLTSTTEPAVGSITYDAHGNTTSIWGEERTYDATDRHIGTIKGSAEVSYRRDPGGRVIERSATGDSTERLGFLDGTDGTDFTQDADGALIERYIALPGGALLTKRADGQIWSLPNVHGDTAVTTDASGVVQGQARTYDAFGAVTGSPLADNSAGTFDYGWLGEKQRPTEHTAGLAATIEMGARQYDPVLGRFLQVDPVEGGSANDYDYVNGDPVNDFDLTGTCGFGNPFKKCGRGHKGRCLFGKQGRGCRWGKTWRAAHRGKRWAHRHFTVSISGCAIACLGVAYHHGHLGLVAGHGCCSAGIYGGYVKRWRTYRSSRHGSACAGYYATACWQHRRRRQFVHEGHGLSLGFGGGYSYTRTRWN